MRFYAHLAAEEGVSVKRGVIVRADGRRSEILISKEDAAEEGRRARSVLNTYREATSAEKSFAELAMPRADSCAHCECIPFCEAFWTTAADTWAADCGTHIEGTVVAAAKATIHGARLITLRVTTRRGTFPGSEAQLELLPAEWLEVDDDARIVEGSVVRIVHALLMNDRPDTVRTDRAATMVWLVT